MVVVVHVHDCDGKGHVLIYRKAQKWIIDHGSKKDVSCVSPINEATHWQFGGTFSKDFVKHLLLNMIVKELWKFVSVCHCYG